MCQCRGNSKFIVKSHGNLEVVSLDCQCLHKHGPGLVDELLGHSTYIDYAICLNRKGESLILQASINPSVFQDTSMATSGSIRDVDDTKPSGYAI